MPPNKSEFKGFLQVYCQITGLKHKVKFSFFASTIIFLMQTGGHAIELSTKDHCSSSRFNRPLFYSVLIEWNQ